MRGAPREEFLKDLRSRPKMCVIDKDTIGSVGTGVWRYLVTGKKIQLGKVHCPSVRRRGEAPGASAFLVL